MTPSEANVLIEGLREVRHHFDSCREHCVCDRCNLGSSKAANTLDDAIRHLRTVISQGAAA